MSQLLSYSATLPDLDLLVESAACLGELAAGVSAAYVARQSALGGRAAIALARSVGTAAPRQPAWSHADERFLAEHLGVISEEEIGAVLGRTAVAVRIHWKRDMGLRAPSKSPALVTAEQIANGLHIRCSKSVHTLIDRGILPGRRLPLPTRVIRVCDRLALLRWMIDPMHWVYFDPRRVGTGPRRAAAVYDAEFWDRARRLVERARERWHDAWWRIGRVARYHRVDAGLVNKAIREGKLAAVDWGNWWVKKSDATAPHVHFFTGRGRPGVPKSRWPDDADAFLVLARACGCTWTVIGRMMKKDEEVVRLHAGALARRGEIPRLIRRHGFKIRYNGGTDGLYADWHRYAGRFPGLVRRLAQLDRKAHRTASESQELRRIARHAALAPKARNPTRSTQHTEEDIVDIQVQISTNLQVQLSEAEARDFLVDPAPVQAQVRSRLAGVRSGLKTNGHAPGKTRGGARRAMCDAHPRGTDLRQPRSVTCADCGKSFGTEFALTIHRARMHKSPHPGDEVEG